MEKLSEGKNSSSRLWTGVIILAVGLVFFLRNFGIDIPDWIVSWHMLLIAIGLLIGYKRNFNGGGWLIMVLVGVYFTLQEITYFDLSKYAVAVGFIIAGLFLILRPKSNFSHKQRRNKKRWKDKVARFDDLDQEMPVEEQPAGFDNYDKNDILDSVNVFGGSHQNVYSKNFKGGDVIAIFGGADINLTQADFKEEITLDIVAIFGGAKIIIPPGWQVKSEVTAIFGGLDDKRAIAPANDGPRKIVIIKGVALFGGVDIRNF